MPFVDEIRGERISEIERVAEHVDLSLTELYNARMRRSVEPRQRLNDKWPVPRDDSRKQRHVTRNYWCDAIGAEPTLNANDP